MSTTRPRRVQIGDRSSRRKLGHSPAHAASRRAARATAPQSYFQQRPDPSQLRSLLFPLMPLRGGPLGPRLRTGIFSKDGSLAVAEPLVSRSWLRPARATPPESYSAKTDPSQLRSLLFPAHRYGPLGPPLRKQARRQRSDRALFAEPLGRGQVLACRGDVGVGTCLCIPWLRPPTTWRSWPW
jgi:hypothetical protein